MNPDDEEETSAGTLAAPKLNPVEAVVAATETDAGANENPPAEAPPVAAGAAPKMDAVVAAGAAADAAG